MGEFLEYVTSAVQQADPCERPTLPNIGLIRVKTEPIRSARDAAFKVMKELVALVWPTMSSTERKRKERLAARPQTCESAAPPKPSST